MEILHFLFGIFGNATALFLFLAPTPWVCFLPIMPRTLPAKPVLLSFGIPIIFVFFAHHSWITFKRILKSRSTEDFSGVPYIATLLNCLLSAWYGLPFVSPHNLLVSTINGAGTAIEAVYVVLFLAFAINGRTRAKVGGLLALVLAVFAGVVLVSLLALHGQHRKIFCGFAATIFSICMYASPLSIMRVVIKTKSVEYMPFFLSLFVFLCGTSWFIYGLLGRDPFIAVPNGFGCGLGALQLILYAIYRDWGGKDKEDKKVVSSGKASAMDSSAAAADAMEMGIMHEECNTNTKEPSSLSNGGKASNT